MLQKLDEERRKNIELHTMAEAHKAVLLELQTRVLRNEKKLKEIDAEDQQLINSISAGLVPPVPQAPDDLNLMNLDTLFAEAWPETVAAQ